MVNSDEFFWSKFLVAKEAQKQKLRALLCGEAAFRWALLRRPESKIADLDLGNEFARDALTTVETEVKYAGYIAQQNRQVVQLKEAERRGIPNAFRYSDIPGLSSAKFVRNSSESGRRPSARREKSPASHRQRWRSSTCI